MISSNDAAQLSDVIETLILLDNSFIADNVSRHFLEINDRREVNELQVRGNVAGLVHLARKILEVAKKGVEGAHYHLDDAELVDRCDLPVVISLKKAEWDD